MAVSSEDKSRATEELLDCLFCSILAFVSTFGTTFFAADCRSVSFAVFNGRWVVVAVFGIDRWVGVDRRFGVDRGFGVERVI